MISHEKYMNRVMELALLGKGKVAPNPLVGCVIVHQDKIVGEGYHRQYGSLHAEPNALASIDDTSMLPECTLYVNLEPCNHHGKTPPCSQTIVKAGIRKVVIANKDPHSIVSGQGIKYLQKAGVEVIVGILEEEGEELNRRFFTFHRNERPYVILKWAQTGDGFIDRNRTSNEEPLQISNKENSALVHQWRSEEAAILVGMNTILNDNPSLTVRHVMGNNPIRISLDSEKTQVKQEQFSFFDQSTPTLVYTVGTEKNDDNLEFIHLPNLSIANVLNDLYKRNIQSVIIEGGQTILSECITSNLWNEARVTTSNQILKNGIKAPQIGGKLKSKFTSGKNCLVSIFSPL